MLQLRPNCEYCDKDLPPASGEAYICTFECTFCKDCALTILQNVCPNCGGNFCPRPIRPVKEWRPGVSLKNFPPATKRNKLAFSQEDIAAHITKIKGIAPEDR